MGATGMRDVSLVRRAGAWCRAAAVLVVPICCARATEGEAEAFDPGKATGVEIQAFRDQYVPREYRPPARAWFYADVAVVAGLLLSGSWLVRAHRPSRWISAQLALALAYLGIFRGGCICPVGATANVMLGLSRPEMVGLATLALFLVPLVAALACGRVFCGAVCPLGAVQQLLSTPDVRRLPRRLHRTLLALPVVVLVAAGLAVWSGRGFLPCRLDPYSLLFFQGHVLVQQLVAWVGLGAAEPVWIWAGGALAWALSLMALSAGRFIPRVFCRYACPYGVLLGALAAVAFWRREIDPAGCVRCDRCASQCPVQAIELSPDGKTLKLSSYQCVQCGRCSDVCKRTSV